MGSSLDWTKEYFTIDDKRAEAVTNAYVKLFDDGMIYRDTKLVNWCCALQTAISDIEVTKLGFRLFYDNRLNMMRSRRLVNYAFQIKNVKLSLAYFIHLNIPWLM